MTIRLNLKFIIFSLIFFSVALNTYSQDVKEMHDNAKSFMKQGDYSNAIIVLNKAAEIDPKNVAVSKDLALSYYFNNDPSKAIQIINRVLEGNEADEQSFQIAGTIYKALNELSETEKIYRKGLKNFPSSGPLHNDLGELLWAKKDYSAIKLWEKGIEKDPSFPKNYYNAARYHYLSTDKVWSLVYGEIFLIMEPFTSKSAEIKDLLYESYKKLFIDPALEKKEVSRFEIAYHQTLMKQSSVAAAGITPESLMMIRTRFILDWFNEGRRPAFKLFDHHRQLLHEGMFEAYNQWLFGPAQNLTGFQNWISAHPDQYAAFVSFQKNTVIKFPVGEYYQKL